MTGIQYDFLQGPAAQDRQISQPLCMLVAAPAWNPRLFLICNSTF
jgi:hypothetical protein